MTVLAEDTFTDTNGTVLNTHTPSGTVPGVSWADFGSVAASRITIDTNRVYANNATFGNLCGCLLTKASAYSADQVVEADLIFQTDSVNDFVAILARGNSVDFAVYMLRWQSAAGAWQLGRYNASAAFTQLGSNVAFAFPAGGTTKHVKLTVIGNQISAYVDGSLIIGPITDSTIAGPGTPGMTWLVSAGQGPTTGILLDNFQASDAGAPPDTVLTDIPHSRQWQAVIAQ